jgi:hypothetical protein
MFVVLISLCLCGNEPVWATTESDLIVGLKTIPLLKHKFADRVFVSIIFDPDNSTSKEDAQVIKSILDSGMVSSGGVQLTTGFVSINQLSKLDNAKIAFITPGLSTSAQEALYERASQAGVLTISTDLNCVRTNKCVLGVVSQPSVEIYYSHVAAEAARISFVQVFTMLVKHI